MVKTKPAPARKRQLKSSRSPAPFGAIFASPERVGSGSGGHWLLAALLVLVLAYAAGNVLAFNLTASLEKRIDTVRPAKIQLLAIIDPSCTACADFSTIAQELPQDRFAVTDQARLDWQTTEAQALVQRYGLQSVPALVITGEVDRPAAAEFFAAAGLAVENGSVIRSGIPPFRDLKTGSLVGMVSLTLLNDSTCAACYDADVNKAVLQNFGIAVQSARIFDVASSEGKALLAAYNVTKVPAMVLSPDAQAYGKFLQVWSQVGTVESDGFLVLRSPEVLGTYRDLASGQVVTPQS